ncbi:MAG: hypothetical protein R3B09_17350 [Nannocystaceae bacterium]
MPWNSRSLASLVAIASLAALAGACAVDLEEQLEGEPCTVEDDCWHTQQCARTIEEETFNLPGVCQPDGTECVYGRQLGCGCAPADPTANCTAPAVPIELQTTYPRMACDPTLLRCVMAPTGGGM